MGHCNIMNIVMSTPLKSLLPEMFTLSVPMIDTSNTVSHFPQPKKSPTREKGKSNY